MFFTGSKLQGDLETIRKILRKSQRDIRVILIKLADRLHNMRTMNSKKEVHKRIKKANETMDVFVAIAARLGIWRIKRELETLSFKIIYPEATRDIQLFLKKNDKKRQSIYQQISSKIKQYDTNKLIKKITPYERGLFAFQKEMNRKKRKKPLLNDTLVLQLITEKKNDCYLAIGVIHSIWKNLQKQEEDFISNPRENGYCAFHTTIVTKDGYIVQCRILCTEMRKRNWFGVTYDHFLKKKHEKTNFLLPLKLIDKFTKNNPEKFFAAAKTDLFGEKIEVHVAGKSLNIPISATALDVVFQSYPTKVFYIKKIFINDEQVSLHNSLNDGDYIKILFTRKETIGFEWLYHVKTTLAKIEIQKYLTKSSLKKKKLLGKTILQKEFYLHKQGNFNFYCHYFSKRILEKYKLKTLDKLFINIAEGKLHPYDVYQAWNIKRFYFWKNILQKLSIKPFKKEQKFYLNLQIKGKISARFNPIPRVYEIKENFQHISIKKNHFHEKNNFFTMKILFLAKSNKYFHDLLTRLQYLPGVLKVDII